jgi:hypothetical protein
MYIKRDRSTSGDIYMRTPILVTARMIYHICMWCMYNLDSLIYLYVWLYHQSLMAWPRSTLRPLRWPWITVTELQRIYRREDSVYIRDHNLASYCKVAGNQ